MICPIRSNCYSNNPVECCKENCAWWLGDGCAVAYVGGNCKSAFENERANNGEELIEAWNTRSESVRRIKDSDLPKTSPLSGILCVIGDELKPEDCDHCIITDGFADWNMPRSIKVSKIVPEGGWIEVVS